MKNRIFFYLALISVTVFLFLETGCKKRSTKSSDSINFIDVLTEKNIKKSPFLDIEKHFSPVKEVIENIILFPEFSTSKEKVWAAVTKMPVLSVDETTKPSGMEVMLKDSPIAYLGADNKGQLQWQLIKCSREIDIQNNDNFNKRFRCLILDEDDSFQFEAILPPVPLNLKVTARRNWHPLNILVYLDDNLIGEEALNNIERTFSFPIETHLGMHKLTLKFKKTEPSPGRTGPTPPRMLLYDISLKSPNDLILIHAPSEEETKLKTQPFEIKYLSKKKEHGEKNPYATLYKLKQMLAIHHTEQPENPLNIKKKINLEDLNINVIMAPPESQFEFNCRVPENGLLKFGTGILKFSSSPIPPGQEIEFKVLVRSDTEDEIFKRTLPIERSSSRELLEIKKIDLSSYAGQEVDIIFITKAAENRYDNENVFSFWYNPILYKPEIESPKIILISLDTLRADHLGCYGYVRPTSPNLDELAKDSVLFEKVYAQSPWTLPSHTSMLYSLNTASHQVYYNDQRIDQSLPSLSSILKNSGYETYAFTGGGYVSNLFGFAKGFNWYEEPVGGRHAVLSEYEAEELYSHTAEWLKNYKDRPFFLFLHTFQIHGPYHSPPPWNTMFLDEDSRWERMALRRFLDSNPDYSFSKNEIENIIALYDSEIRYTDETLIKPLVDSLKQLDIYDQTLLIITSDHGEEFFEHKGWLHGGALYNEQLHVPLIIKFPESEFKGTRVKSICRSIDIMPTIFEALSIKYDKNQFDGKSLLDMIKGKEKSDRKFISDLAYKDILDPCPAQVSTNKDNLKIIVEKSTDGIKKMEIFNIEKDPTEQINLLREKRELGFNLLKELDSYYEEKSKIQRQIQKITLDEKLKEKLKALGYIR